MNLNYFASGKRSHYLHLLVLVCAFIFMLVGCSVRYSATGIPEGFLALIGDDDLNGWHRSLTTHHGLSGHFFIEEGAIVLRQHPFGQGGILLSDQRFKDFELRFEFKGDPGTNGGLLFRSAESGTAYQLELVGDGGKGTGAFFGEMLKVEKTVPAPDLSHIWKKGDWNSFGLRVMGDKPNTQLWINGKLIWQHQMERNDLMGGISEGMIGLQLHWSSTLLPIPGGSCCGYSWKPEAAHRYRNLFIKAL
ncbi:MAG: DUF1080 domain-containing protein [Cyclobacteriaceae bacterium]